MGYIDVIKRKGRGTWPAELLGCPLGERSMPKTEGVTAREKKTIPFPKGLTGQSKSVAKKKCNVNNDLTHPRSRVLIVCGYLLLILLTTAQVMESNSEESRLWGQHMVNSGTY